MVKVTIMQQAMSDEVKMVGRRRIFCKKAAKSLAEKYDVDMPIIMEVGPRCCLRQNRLLMRYVIWMLHDKSGNTNASVVINIKIKQPI